MRGPISTLNFSSLSYTVKVKGQTRLLTDDVNVTVRAGEMIGKRVIGGIVRPLVNAVTLFQSAIMGPSGAGESRARLGMDIYAQSY